MILFDARETPRRWLTTNDTVMGGRSQSETAIKHDSLIFSGMVSLENNGGFASIRSVDHDWDLSDCHGLCIRARGDGHHYRCTLRTDFEMRAGSYGADFLPDPGVWSEIELPFNAFVARSFGRPIAAPRLNLATIRSVGFLISHGQSGAFRLEVARISTLPAA